MRRPLLLWGLLLWGLPLSAGCASAPYVEHLRQDLSQCVRGHLGLGLGIYAEAELSSAIRPAIGFGDISLSPKYTMGYDPRPGRTRGRVRTAAFPTLLVAWPFYGLGETREGYGNTHPYWRGFVAPWFLMGCHHVQCRTTGLLYLDRAIGHPRLEEAALERERSRPAGAQEHGWLAASATAGFVSMELGVNVPEVLDATAALFGLDLLGDQPTTDEPE